MEFEIEYEIKAILFGVDETVINNLDLGNSYVIEKDRMNNSDLWEKFDYTTFGLRRVYETAKLNRNLEVAVLTKKVKESLENVTFIEGKGFCCEGKEISDIIYEYETSEMHYIDEKMRLIRLYSENCFNIKELLINSTVTDKIKKEQFLKHNSKIPFPDKIMGNIKKLRLSTKEEIQAINSYLKSTSLQFEGINYSSNILKSAAFLYDQSYTSPIVTLRFMVCVIGLESLLVDGKGAISYKFSRNGAMLLSEDKDEYFKILSKLKKIYRKRSEYVHNGNVDNLEEKDVIEVREILRKTIFKIIEKNKTKKELLQGLDLKGYL